VPEARYLYKGLSGDHPACRPRPPQARLLARTIRFRRTPSGERRLSSGRREGWHAASRSPGIGPSAPTAQTSAATRPQANGTRGHDRAPLTVVVGPVRNANSGRKWDQETSRPRQGIRAAGTRTPRGTSVMRARAPRQWLRGGRTMRLGHEDAQLHVEPERRVRVHRRRGDPQPGPRRRHPLPLQPDRHRTALASAKARSRAPPQSPIRLTMPTLEISPCTATSLIGYRSRR
jgi:hypothetical protein